MSAPIHISAPLSLIEDAARGARMADAQAAILTAQMDIRSTTACEARDNALNALRGLAAILGPPPPMSVPPQTNGRMKLTE